MNKGILKFLIVPVMASCFALDAQAVSKGLYLGIMAGPANNSGGTQQALYNPANPDEPSAIAQFTPATPRGQQFGTRPYIGYKFNTYAAFELGFQFFSTINYDTKDVQILGGATTRVRDIDLVAKGYLPIGPNFDVFGKAGVAYTYVTTGSAFNPETVNEPPQEPYIAGRSQYLTKVSPTFSVGASYDINQAWVIDGTFSTIMIGGKPGNVSTIAFGLSYHFVDVYCGQFLCDD